MRKRLYKRTIYLFVLGFISISFILFSCFYKTTKNDEIFSVCIHENNINQKEQLYTSFTDGNLKNKSMLQIMTQAIKSIRRDCGQLCNTSSSSHPGRYFNSVTAPVDCQSIFSNSFIDKTHNLEHAPRQIPCSLWSDFTMAGRIQIIDYYFDQPYLKHHTLPSIWTLKMVNGMLISAKQGILEGTYGYKETNALRDGLRHAPGIKEGRVLVIGSENPWVEACVLEAGATEIVTLEYSEVMSEHPKIKPMTPLKFREQKIDNSLGQFSAVVTFSSVEHTGLGRYGDILNPWGDIIAIARAWCVTKNGGSLTIGVMYDYENDRIRFNADRIYGKIRLPYLLTNWKQIYQGKGSQRVHVLMKTL